MNHTKKAFLLFSLIVSIVLMSAVHTVVAQERETFSKGEVEKAKAENKYNQSQKAAAPVPNDAAAAAKLGIQGCLGPVSQVLDIAFEGLKFTSANYFANPGGGEGGGFDKTPVLSTRVRLGKGTCLDAHFSAIVGSRQTYGVAPLTLFQVTLTPVNGGPRHMIGHYETPYGSKNGPAVAIEAERDVDIFASNFFQRVGTDKHEVLPGTYRVDVWWAGNGADGAIGADFVLKLYLK